MFDLKPKPKSDRESRNRTLELFWKDRNVDALVARLLVTHALPLDLRRRIEHDVECLEWREYYDQMKHYDQTVKERRRDLIRELRRLGCEPRADSALCKGFVYQTLEPTTWTAKAVARRMAEMKYVHSYCDTFKKKVDDMREKFENLCDKYMGEYDDEYDEYDDDDEYDEYDSDRLDRADARQAACEDTTGYRYFGTYVSELAKNWKKFPEKWPWSIPDDIPEEDVDEAGDPRETFDAERSELDEDNKDEGTGADENDENEEREEDNEDEDSDDDDSDDFDEDVWSGDEFFRYEDVWYEDSD